MVDGERVDRLTAELRRQWGERFRELGEREARQRHAVSHGQEELYDDVRSALAKKVNGLSEWFCKLEERLSKHPEERDILSDLERRKAQDLAQLEALQGLAGVALSAAWREREAADRDVQDARR